MAAESAGLSLILKSFLNQTRAGPAGFIHLLLKSAHEILDAKCAYPIDL
jgi:hypothetical protein